jgi:hypothetical protein
MAGLEVAFGSEIEPDFAVLFLQPLELLGLSCKQTVDELVTGTSMPRSLATTLCAARFLIRIEVITGQSWRRAVGKHGFHVTSSRPGVNCSGPTAAATSLSIRMGLKLMVFLIVGLSVDRVELGRPLRWKVVNSAQRFCATKNLNMFSFIEVASLKEEEEEKLLFDSA